MELKDYKDIVFDIIGAAMEVHSELKWGLLEPIYNESLHLELLDRNIKNEREVYLPCKYKHHPLEKYYQMDIVVGDIIVELKSVSCIKPEHRAQLFNYLRLTKKPIGLILNFGQPSLQSERYAFFDETNECFLLDKDMNILKNIRQQLYAQQI
ncbi:MAG: GxxExxY protein [Muribaculaceae bacterium]|jgi:GxxExxY protein|nr:GxxExxY protein [Muribaculaceae bacterium]